MDAMQKSGVGKSRQIQGGLTDFSEVAMVRGETASCGASPARGCPGCRRAVLRAVLCSVQVRADVKVLQYTGCGGVAGMGSAII